MHLFKNQFLSSDSTRQAQALVPVVFPLSGRFYVSEWEGISSRKQPQSLK